MSEPAEEQGCMECRFCRDIRKDDDGYETGTCHRFPPVLSPMGGEDKHDFEHDEGRWCGRYDHDWICWVQPRVGMEGWCGEFQPRKQE